MVEGKLRKASQVSSFFLQNIMGAEFVEPNNPTGILGVTLKMAGMGTEMKHTATRNCRLLVLLTGLLKCDTNNKIASAILKRGTGAAPANGDAATGTTMGTQAAAVGLTVDNYVPFSVIASASLLDAGEQIWFDFALATDDAGATADLAQVFVTFLEL